MEILNESYGYGVKLFFLCFCEKCGCCKLAFTLLTGNRAHHFMKWTASFEQ